jgi:glc operon protein GlcG
MLGLRVSCLQAIVALAVLLGPAAAQEKPPAAPAQLLSLPEARAIIDGAIAYSRGKNMLMGVAVVDVGGDIISADRMDEGSSRNVQFAAAKAFASAMYRTTTEALSQLYKTRPDRYFGITNMYGNKVYLVGGGVPLAVDGKLVGAVGVAGLPQGEDEAAARAGIAAWEKMRGGVRK